MLKACTDEYSHREQDKATGYKPGLWACITGNLIILAIISVTDVYFYFCNKKQARGELIIEPVPGTDSEVSFRGQLWFGEHSLTPGTGQVQVHLLSGWED